MRSVPWLAVLAVALAAGCAGPAPAGPSTTATTTSSGTEDPGGATAGPFLLVVLWNKDFYSTPEEVRKDRYDAFDHEGRMLHFLADPGPGTGRVDGPDGAFLNVTRAEVLAHLRAIGTWNASQDHEVDEAWRATVPQPEWGNLSRILAEERELPEDNSSHRVGCADGGSALIRVSAPEGNWERTIGCLPSQSPTEAQSGNRILQAFHAAKDAARATLGPA